MSIGRAGARPRVLSNRKNLRGCRIPHRKSCPESQPQQSDSLTPLFLVHIHHSLPLQHVPFESSSFDCTERVKTMSPPSSSVPVAPGGIPQKKPISYSNLLLGAGLNMFEYVYSHINKTIWVLMCVELQRWVSRLKC